MTNEMNLLPERRYHIVPVISKPTNKLQDWQLERFVGMVSSVKTAISEGHTLKARRLVASYYKDTQLVKKLDAIDIILTIDGKLSYRLLEEVNAWTQNLLHFIRVTRSIEEYQRINEALRINR